MGILSWLQNRVFSCTCLPSQQAGKARPKAAASTTVSQQPSVRHDAGDAPAGDEAEMQPAHRAYQDGKHTGAPLPANEEERCGYLCSLNVLDSAPEGASSMIMRTNCAFLCFLAETGTFAHAETLRSCIITQSHGQPDLRFCCCMNADRFDDITKVCCHASCAVDDMQPCRHHCLYLDSMLACNHSGTLCLTLIATQLTPSCGCPLMHVWLLVPAVLHDLQGKRLDKHCQEAACL